MRTYIRKTKTVYRIQGNYGYGHGWETECEEDTRKEALARLKEYRENGPGSYRLRVGREKLNVAGI